MSFIGFRTENQEASTSSAISKAPPSHNLHKSLTLHLLLPQPKLLLSHHLHPLLKSLLKIQQTKPSHSVPRTFLIHQVLQLLQLTSTFSNPTVLNSCLHPSFSQCNSHPLLQSQHLLLLLVKGFVSLMHRVFLIWLIIRSKTLLVSCSVICC